MNNTEYHQIVTINERQVVEITQGDFKRYQDLDGRELMWNDDNELEVV